MTSDDGVVAVLDALNQTAIPYMVVGSLSTNFYGVPRSTRDADFVIQLENRSINELAARLGPEFVLDPQMSFETVTGTTKYVLRLADLRFKFELFLLSSEEYDQERFRRRRKVQILGRDAYLPTLEDAVVQKILWGRRANRRKDLDDISNVIALRSDEIDWAYVHGWCDRHGSRELLDEIVRTLPERPA